jgi:hypothetical protein
MPSGAPRVRHYYGMPDAPDRIEMPQPTLVLMDESSAGVSLIRLTSTGEFCGDTWHQTLDDARNQLAFEFESVGTFQPIPADVTDAEAFVTRTAAQGTLADTD